MAIGHSSKSPAIRSVVFVSILLLLASLAGCATKTLSTAVKLSQDGQTAVAEIRNLAVLSDDALKQTVRVAAFVQAYRQGKSTLDKAGKQQTSTQVSTTKAENTLVKLQKIITANIAWLKSLQESYAALEALASFDASGEFLKSYGRLSTATVALAKAANSTILSDISSNSDISRMGQELVSFIQKQKVIAASKGIHTYLDETIAILSQDDIKILYTALHEEYLRHGHDATIAMMDANVVSYTPIAEEILSISGLKPSKNFDTSVSKNAALKAGIQQFIETSYDQHILEISESYNKAIDALKKLKKAHTSLENNGIKM